MEKEFIPYDLALALKGLGFDEPCFGIWMERGKVHDVIYVAKQEDAWMAEQNDGILAPTYQQAFRWFREKYGLRIRNYGSINYSGGLSEYFEIFKYGYGTSNKSLSIEIGALTYEEAELACLEKLIDVISM